MIKDGTVRWIPSINVNQIILGGQIVAIVLLLTIRAIARMRTRNEERRTAGERIAGSLEGARRRIRG